MRSGEALSSPSVEPLDAGTQLLAVLGARGRVGVLAGQRVDRLGAFESRIAQRKVGDHPEGVLDLVKRLLLILLELFPDVVDLDQEAALLDHGFQLLPGDAGVLRPVEYPG